MSETLGAVLEAQVEHRIDRLTAACERALAFLRRQHGEAAYGNDDDPERLATIRALEDAL